MVRRLAAAVLLPLAYSPDGQLVAAGLADGRVRPFYASPWVEVR